MAKHWLCSECGLPAHGHTKRACQDRLVVLKRRREASARTRASNQLASLERKGQAGLFGGRR